jgi:hypothetical protein
VHWVDQGTTIGVIDASDTPRLDSHDFYSTHMRFQFGMAVSATPRDVPPIPPRASPLESRASEARHNALRPRRSGRRRTLGRTRHRVRGPFRALRASFADAADRDRDQPAGTGSRCAGICDAGGRGDCGCSLNSRTRCLNVVDTFRGGVRDGGSDNPASCGVRLAPSRPVRASCRSESDSVNTVRVGSPRLSIWGLRKRSSRST